MSRTTMNANPVMVAGVTASSGVNQRVSGMNTGIAYSMKVT